MPDKLQPPRRRQNGHSWADQRSDPFAGLLDEEMPPGQAFARTALTGMRIFDLTSALVTTPAGPPMPLRGRLAGPVSMIGTALSGICPTTNVGWKSGHIVCLVPGTATPRAVDLAHRAAQCVDGSWNHIALTAAGPAGTGIEGVRRSYVVAVEIVEMLAACPGLPRALTFDQALPYLLLHRGTGSVQDALCSRLSPILSRRTLLDTLEAFVVAGGNIVRAASGLGVSSRTVHRRINRIERLTGLGVRSDLTLSHLAICSVQFRSDSSSKTNGRSSTAVPRRVSVPSSTRPRHAYAPSGVRTGKSESPRLGVPTARG